ncbi:ATP-binding protein [Streptomyces sp. GSL17-111]|uniref:ATP-binding protein n=1 Tax=Streptomyces sp. GSL17-111 TaxID=3121596 RepID=UPI0030F476EB
MLKRPVERTGKRGRRAKRRDTWWAATAAVALVLGAAGAAAPGSAPWVRVALGVLTATAVVGVATTFRLRGRLAAVRAAQARAESVAGARGAEVAHLAGVRMPAIAERVRAGQRLDGLPGPVTAPEATGEDFARAVAALAGGLGSDDAVRRERALRDSVQAAFESVARNMHAMATVQQQVLDNVERIISDARLMSEVMKADHAAAQMTRKAQTLLVMCGIWPARRETRPVTLFDCVRGAQSRIVEFGRVDVHGGQTLHVVPPAVEGLMHTVAELLENATVFSPSSTQVVVTVREVGAGAVVEIDDAGLGMPPDVLHQALGQLRDDLDLAQLGAVPRLGLACVGRWARELGFNVELTGASAYGGTRAVIFVPHRLLTEPVPEAPRPEARTRPEARDGHAYAGQPLGAPHDPVRAPASVREPAPAPAYARTRAEERPGAHEAQEAHDAQAAPALPRRRNRRRAPGGGPPGLEDSGGYGSGATPAPPAYPQPYAQPYAQPAPHDLPHDAPHARPPAPAWSPEAARASVASVVSGSRRGRAEAQDPQARHTGVQDSDQTDHHDGGTT